ncbi:cationic peroxidase 1-like [Spinacia oleracea]|uniref:Peroxidase n=1 Tax=Spinacia oleracea TaxID=3562 RepID=A0A9R0JG44_SPIOL|nr:cationic peroxidase 1-like [Spinacia oleracea]
MASFSLSFLQWCLISILFRSAFSQLSENFYSASCPKAHSIISHHVKNAIKKEPRMGASMLRLQFHDCGVGGCDGSNLLDDTKNSTGEKSALLNLNSARGFEVIDKIKNRLEQSCPGVVSCADILAMVGRECVFRLGGPNYTLPLGRRDSTESHRLLADAMVPIFLKGVEAQIAAFQSLGFNKNEFVALTGAHTVGMARCESYRQHIYEDKNIDPTFAASLQANCPKEGGNNNTAPIDNRTPFVFDNMYFVNLMKQKGLLATDQGLFTGKGGPTDAIVANYSSSKDNFFKEFASAIVKFGQLGVLTGTKGEIRTNCRKVNTPKA